MTDIDALAIELHKHLFVTVTDWRDEAGDWDSLGEQAKSEYRLVARRVRDMVTGPPAANPGDTYVEAVIAMAEAVNGEPFCEKTRAEALRDCEDGGIAAPYVAKLRELFVPIDRARDLNAQVTEWAGKHQQATHEIDDLRTQCEVMAKALEQTEALLECVKQGPNNLWWIDADDPEEAVCDTHSDIGAALQSYRTIRGEIK